MVHARACPIKLLHALRVIFTLIKVSTYIQYRCFYLGILPPLPKLGVCYFYVEFEQVTSCPGVSRMLHDTYIVIPAKAGISGHKRMSLRHETPAFAGVTR